MASRFLRSRKGADSPAGSSGAAFLILIITLIIIFYILFLPPEDRENLLSSGTVPGTPSSPTGGFEDLLGTTSFQTNIGSVDYVDDEPIEHEFNSFTIYTTKDAQLIKQIGALSIKNSAFDTKNYELDFSVDKRVTENVQLTFNVARESGGTLLVYLNGDLLYEGSPSVGSLSPIKIPADQLKNDNILFFAVSRPGFAFWSTNEYDLEYVTLTGDVTDDSNSFNTQKFYIAETEYNKFKKATLQFFPDCSYSTAGKITVTLNGEQVFYGLPDCGLKNFFTVGKDQLIQGENRIEFTSDAGSYIIDQLKLDVTLQDAEYPVYYFDLDEDLFVDVNSDPRCGETDGYCPSNCEAYEDRDCCFDDSKNNYWCDLKTENVRDRCVNTVLASYVDRCESGYEDISGDPADEGEGLCGDDTDDYCPAGCSADYDKDCCFETSGAFWCDDVPYTGRDSVCTTSVTSAECQACPSGYRDEDRDRPNCPAVEEDTTVQTEVKAGVDIVMEVFFTDESYKKVDFNINGNIMPVDTYSISAYRTITPYVREGINSLVIQPRKDVDIAQLKIVVE
ncbi:MAG: hypothetical protein KC535_00670 [Nanoarchaeota archaeon]|nr:hypothetical protein [Nanoarchaeota archaeon]